MSVTALGPYEFAPRDTQGNFPAPLVYIGWDHHRMFCAAFCLPLPPDTPFGVVPTAVLPGMFAEHPDFERIDWSTVQWTRNGQPWQPDPARSVADNGLRHKDVIRFRTPGLNGIGGSTA